MMKASRFTRFGGPEVLEIADLPDPRPGPGQVRIASREAIAVLDRVGDLEVGGRVRKADLSV